MVSIVMEKTMNAKVVGAASAAVLLAGSGAALAAVPAMAVPAEGGVQAAVAAAGQGTVGTAAVPAKTVSGRFLFTQEMTTTTDVIRTVFAKASAVLCSSLPQYGMADAGAPVTVTGPDGAVLGTLDELAGDEGSTIMVGCACATNSPGGGAIANAGVSGTTLAALLAAVGV